ncbi:unnamed protein product, partial [Rotaria sp. Silwood1]
AFPYILPWLMNRFFSNDYKYALLFESILIFTCILFGLLMIPLPIEPSEQRHLRYKLQSESKEEANKHILNNIDNGNNQTNEQMNQHE